MGHILVDDGTGGVLSDVDTGTKALNTGLFFNPVTGKYEPAGGLKTIVAKLDTTATGGQNGLELQSALNQATVVAANTGSKVRVETPAGTFLIDYPQHALLTASFHLGTDATFSVNDARDFPASGTIKVTSRDWCQLQAAPAEATLTYTRVGNVFTVVSITAGSGNTYSAGDGVNVSGVGETREIVTFVGDNLDLVGYGSRLDMSNAVMVNPGSSKSAQLLRVGADPTAAKRYCRGTIWPGQQWVNVGNAIQPNSAFDATYTGDYATADDVLIQGDSVNDYDPSRTNPPGEITIVADAREFGTYLKTTVDNAVLSLTVQPQLSNRTLLDPNSTSTTINQAGGLAAGGSETSLVVTSAIALAYREPLNAHKYPSRTGLLFLDDGAGNSELISFEGVDYTTNTLLNLRRGLLGTSKLLWANGVTVKMCALLKIENELCAYSTYNFNTTITLLKRGLNGTAAAAHTVTTTPAYEPIISEVPLPGMVRLRNALCHDRPHEPGRTLNPVTTKLAVALGNTYTEGTQVTIEVDDLTDFPASGLVQIANEVVSFTHRDSGKLYNCTRGLHGTTVAVAALGATVKVVPALVKLTADVTSGATVLPINGWPGYQPLGNNNVIRIDDEMMDLKSGSSSSSPSSGYIFQSTTLSNGGSALTAAATTIPLASVAGWTDPVATGVGVAFGIFDSEIFSYTGISGTTLTGVKRGYQTFATTHNDGVTVKHYKSLNVISTGRGYGGTTAASHLAGAFANQAEPAFVQKLALSKKINIRGLEIYAQSSRALFPRAGSTGGPGLNTVMNRKTALKFTYVKGLNIHDCTIDGTERDGISLEPALDVRISSCTFENIAGQGWGNTIDMLGACQDVTIIANTMRHVRHGVITSAAGDKPGQPRRINVIANHIEDAINACYESQASSSHVLVEGNTFISTHAPGMLINSPSCTIRNNHFLHMGGNAIQLANFSRSYGTFSIDGNIFENCDLGIFIFVDDTAPNSAQTTYRVSNNTFRNCRSQCLLITNTATTISGQQAQLIHGVIVTGNQVIGGMGATSTAGSSARFLFKNLRGAVIANNNFADVYSAQEAIYCDTVKDSIINANAIRYRSHAQTGLERSGILLAAGCDKNIVTANRVMGCSAASPIDTSAATATTLANNDVT